MVRTKCVLYGVKVYRHHSQKHSQLIFQLSLNKTETTICMKVKNKSKFTAAHKREALNLHELKNSNVKTD